MKKLGLILLVIFTAIFFKNMHKPLKLDRSDTFKYITDKNFATALDLTVLIIKLISDLGLAFAIFNLFTKW